jgi:hypothetical protein
VSDSKKLNHSGQSQGELSDRLPGKSRPVLVDRLEILLVIKVGWANSLV